MRTAPCRHRRRRQPPLALFGVAAATLALVAACTASGSKPTTTTTATTSTSTTTTTTVASTTTSTTASTTTTTRPSTVTTSTAQAATTIAQTLNCTTANLTISVGGGQAGLTHFGYVILFQNKGPHCFLHGYPGLDGSDASGTAVVSAQRTLSGYLGGLGNGVTEPTFILEPGQTASAFFEGLAPGIPGATCPTYTNLEITPPNETHSVQVLSPQVICQLQIHPVVPGTSGDDPQP